MFLSPKRREKPAGQTRTANQIRLSAHMTSSLGVVPTWLQSYPQAEIEEIAVEETVGKSLYYQFDSHGEHNATA